MMNGSDGTDSYDVWLGRTLRITLADDRVFQGQFIAIDDRRNVLLRYCEALEGSVRAGWLS